MNVTPLSQKSEPEAYDANGIDGDQNPQALKSRITPGAVPKKKKN